MPDNLAEFLRDHGICGVVDFRQRDVLRLHRQQHDRRVRGIDLPISRLAGQIHRKLAASRVDRRLHVASRRVDVAIQVELQSDVGITKLAGRDHLADARDMTELPLQRRGHRGRHRLRTRPRQIRVDADRGKIDLRQRRGRKKREGHCSREQDRERNEGGRDRSPDEWRREIGREFHSVPATALVRIRQLLNRIGDVESPPRSPRQRIERQIHHRRRVQRKQLAQQQPANDRNTQGPAKFGTYSAA